MTDILDEILAATESVRSQFRNSPPHKPYSNLTVSVAPSSLPFLTPTFSPSPRGIQDDISPFSLLHTPSTYLHKNPPPPPHDPSAAAVAAAISGVPSPSLSHPITTPSSPPPPPHLSVSLGEHSTGSSSPSFTATRQLPDVTSKRSYADINDPQPNLHPNTQAKRQKLDSPVMPPSAKSILERREKAIREGRRKDAKLTEAERRILRRLRNRESAERCRLRRVQQAAQLEKKIESMQLENDRLVAMAEEYENTIQRLETLIENFSNITDVAL